MWDLPGAGFEPVSPAQAGGLFTTEPPGKPSSHFIYLFIYFKLCHMAYQILGPQPGIEPGHTAVKAPSPSHWTTREVPPVKFSCSVVSTLWDPMDCSRPGLPVHHQLPRFTKTHVHWVGDAIQLSHPLSSPSSTFNLSQHQGLFQWVSSASGGQSIGALASASVFPMNIQDWSPLGWTGWISLQSKGLSRVFSNTTVQKHQFFGAQLPL